MSVLIETSLGDLVVDLEVDKCPRTCENFLKLCKVKYYGLNAFFNVSKDFIAQVGDPSATGKGGECFASWHHKQQQQQRKSAQRGIDAPARYFRPEILNSLKHTSRGTVSMAVAPTLASTDGTGEVVGGCGSQFFVTLADEIEYLDGKHAVFGHVVEGFDVLDKLNDVFVDQEGRPLKDVRIRHIEVLEDPFPDPEDGIEEPRSPVLPPDDPSIIPRIGEDESLVEDLTPDEIEARDRAAAAKASALTLEMIGDLPFASVRPPENILFVCKLNPVTQDEDLELIFSRFGKILSCEVIRDKKTGDSLQYAFIEFDEREAAEQAYFKMQNVLVDDRRIWVDFSQSVSKINGVYQSNTLSGREGRRGGGRGGGGLSRGGGPGRGGRGGAAARYRDDVGAPRHHHDGHDARHGGGGRYDMVFDDQPTTMTRRHHHTTSSSSSSRPAHEHDRSSSRHHHDSSSSRPRSRSPPPPRRRDRERDDRGTLRDHGGSERKRNGDRDREWERQRDRDRDRDRERERGVGERDRDRGDERRRDRSGR